MLSHFVYCRAANCVMPTAGRDATGLPFSNIISSRDHGKTWTVATPARRDTTECAVAQLSDASLLLTMRDNRNRSDKSATNGRAMSTTKDLGETWELHAELPQDMGRAGMQVVYIDGTIYFMGGVHDKPVFQAYWPGRRNDI